MQNFNRLLTNLIIINPTKYKEINLWNSIEYAFGTLNPFTIRFQLTPSLQEKCLLTMKNFLQT